LSGFPDAGEKRKIKTAEEIRPAWDTAVYQEKGRNKKELHERGERDVQGLSS